jgi:hypothetical protein
VSEAANSAFFSGFHAGDLVAAGVALGGSVLAFALLPAQPTVADEDDATESEAPLAAAARS